MSEQNKFRELLVYRPGSEVNLGKDLKGIVSQVNIAGQGLVRYEVAWWDGNDRKTAWLEAHEIVSAPAASALRVGFQGGAREP